MSTQEDFFIKFERENQIFHDHIKAMEDADLFGVLNLDGAGGTYFRSGSGPKLTTFTLGAWKFQNAEIHTSDLRVEMLAENGPQKQIQPYQLVHLRARVAEHPRGHLQAWASEITCSNQADKELAAYAEILKKPVILNDHTLGKLTLNRSTNWFESTLKNHIELSVQAKSAEQLELLLPTARFIVENLNDWIESAKQYAANELLDIKNNLWRNKDEPILTRNLFITRMKLCSLSVYRNNTFSLMFDDDSMFLGHAIEIPCSLQSGCIEAKLSG